MQKLAMAYPWPKGTDGELGRHPGLEAVEQQCCWTRSAFSELQSSIRGAGKAQTGLNVIGGRPQPSSLSWEKQPRKPSPGQESWDQIPVVFLLEPGLPGR